MQLLSALFILTALAALIAWQAPDMLQRLANLILARRAYILAGREAAKRYMQEVSA